MRWYFWVLMVVALIITAVVIVAAVNSGRNKSKKVESEVINSDPNALVTSKSMIYQSLGRNATRAVATELRPCNCSNPNVQCEPTAGLTQCVDCCASKGSTMLSWGNTQAASRCTNCK